jgi:toxin FitB
MFLLDTNVLSAVMGSRPAPKVADWMGARPPDLLFTASVCQAEILSGIAVLPQGRRRAGLEMAALAMFREDFAGRILAFDSEAAVIYAELFAARRSAGRPAATADLMIASIARARGVSVGHTRYRRLRRMRSDTDRSMDESVTRETVGWNNEAHSAKLAADAADYAPLMRPTLAGARVPPRHAPRGPFGGAGQSTRCWCCRPVTA